MEDNLPAYALRFTAYALRTFDEATVYVLDSSGKVGSDAEDYAAAFQDGLYQAVGGLATLPFRFPIAGEAVYLNPPPVRAMVYRHAGGAAWRILYRVLEADENEAARVEIAALLHGSQKPMTQAEAREVDATRD